MKLIRSLLIKMFYIILLISQLSLVATRYLYLDPKDAIDEPGDSYKVMFYYAYEEVRGEVTNPLNQLNYKIAVFSEGQLSFYVSNDPGSKERLGTMSLESYIYTQEYQNIDLPCVKKSFVCTIDQFKKEYQASYSDIDFTVNK